MVLHNYFEISDGTVTRRFYNNMAGIIDSLKRGEKFSSCIRLFTTSGRYTNLAKTDSANFDVLNGTLFIKKSTFIADENMPEGTRVHSVSLCSMSGQSINSATVKDITKGVGPLYVSAVLYLEVGAEDVFLCGGDNPLVRVLLGESVLEDSFKFCKGDVYHDNMPVYRQAELSGAGVVTTADISDSGISFSADLNGYPYEALLYYKDVPVMRRYGFDIQSAMRSLRLDDNGVIYLGDGSQSVLLLRYGSVTVKYTSIPRTKNVSKTAPKVCDYRLEKTTEVLSEPFGNYAALKGERFIKVISISQNDVRLNTDYTVAYGGGRAMLATDGTLFVNEEGGFKQYKKSEGGVNVTCFSEVGDVDDFALGYLPNGYILLARTGTALRVYSIIAGAVLLISSEDIPIDSKIFSCGVSAGWMSESKKTAKAYINGYNYLALSQKLITFLNSGLSGIDIKFNGFVSAKQNGADVIGDIYSGVITQIPQGKSVMAWLMDGAVFSEGGKGMTLDRVSGAFEEIDCPSDFGDVRFSVCLGGYVLTVSGDNYLKFYYVSQKGRYIICPEYAGKALNGTVLSKAADDGTYRTEMKIDLI